MSKSIIALGFSILFALPFAAQADVYDDALANQARSAKDREVDERRKPAEVLRYFEIEQGMRVFDVFAGGGYYSEIISYLVGPQGSVALYNSAP
jgi:predicted methyltransferase